MRTTLLTSLLAVLPTAFAIPPKPEISNTTTLPVNFGIVVFPGFEALDAFGPLDVLNSLSLLFNPPMNLSIISKTLEPVTTVPQMTPGMNMSHGTFGEKIMPTHTFDQIGAGDIDVLLIPGGGVRGTMLDEIAFVKKVYPKLKYAVSVCTGATVLARAGLLDGRKATTNKKAWEWAITTGPNVDWIHQARWVEDGNIWTTSGVAAGIDGMYAWVGHVYGEDVADYNAMAVEYRRVKNSTDDPFAAIWS